MSKSLPKGALRFVAQECHACCFSDEGDDKPKLNMTVYSGKPIDGHWYWGKVAMDLTGVSFSSKFPVLEDHYTGNKIAFSSNPMVSNEEGIKLNPDKTVFVDTPCSQEFRKLSKDGFPYQSSLYGIPSVIERVTEGASVDVNGYKLKGPAYVWRKWSFKEASVCVFGWDSKTSASAFSRNEKEEVELLGELPKPEEAFSKETTEEQEVNEMDLKELKEKNPQLMSQIVEEVRTSLESSFQKERESFTGQITTLKTSLDERDKRISSLEKEDAIRREKDLSFKANGIWAGKLGMSKIPRHLHVKAQAQVGHEKFVKDGVFDETAFTQAVDAEIKDWESRMEEGVKGLGSFSNTTTEPGFNAAAVADDLLNSI